MQRPGIKKTFYVFLVDSPSCQVYKYKQQQC